MGLETVIPQSQGCSSKWWVAAGLEDGQRPTEQLLEADEQSSERHQHLQAFQLIYIHNALCLSKAVFTMQEIHKSVDELAFPARLIQQKNLADAWTICKSDCQQKSAKALQKCQPTAANSFDFLFPFQSWFVSVAFITGVTGNIYLHI